MHDTESQIFHYILCCASSRNEQRKEEGPAAALSHTVQTGLAGPRQGTQQLELLDSKDAVMAK